MIPLTFPTIDPDTPTERDEIARVLGVQIDGVLSEDSRIGLAILAGLKGDAMTTAPTWEPLYKPLQGETIRRRSDEREHYHDRTRRAHDEGVVLSVYVPRPGKLSRIAPGSAIVGSYQHMSEMVVIHFEGGLNAAASGQQMEWEEKLLHASDRHCSAYPTVATMLVSPFDLEFVGAYSMVTNQMVDWPGSDPDKLARWRDLWPERT